MSILTPHIKQTLKLFVQASDNYGVFDFLSLKEALHVAELTINQLLAPEMILLDTGEQVEVETGVKYKRKSLKQYWYDIEMTVEDAVGIHLHRNCEKTIDEIQSPYPIMITRFINLIISPLITQLAKLGPQKTYSMLNSNDNVFTLINKYVDEIEVSTHNEDVVVAQQVLNKRALAYSNPRKKKIHQKGRRRKNETQRYFE